MPAVPAPKTWQPSMMRCSWCLGWRYRILLRSRRFHSPVSRLGSPVIRRRARTPKLLVKGDPRSRPHRSVSGGCTTSSQEWSWDRVYHEHRCDHQKRREVGETYLWTPSFPRPRGTGGSGTSSTRPMTGVDGFQAFITAARSLIMTLRYKPTVTASSWGWCTWCLMRSLNLSFRFAAVNQEDLSVACHERANSSTNRAQPW